MVELAEEPQTGWEGFCGFAGSVEVILRARDCGKAPEVHVCIYDLFNHAFDSKITKKEVHCKAINKSSKIGI